MHGDKRRRKGLENEDSKRLDEIRNNGVKERETRAINFRHSVQCAYRQGEARGEPRMDSIATTGTGQRSGEYNMKSRKCDS